MSDLKKLIEILNSIGVDDDWYSNEEIAEQLIAHGVKYVPPTIKGGNVSMIDGHIDEPKKRYIDADRLIEVLKKHRDWYKHYPSRFRDFEYAIDEVGKQPVADVVEVVRCKDCDVPHSKWTGCPHLNGLIPPHDFYCAKGTPKERGGEK